MFCFIIFLIPATRVAASAPVSVVPGQSILSSLVACSAANDLTIVAGVINPVDLTGTISSGLYTQPSLLAVVAQHLKTNDPVQTVGAVVLPIPAPPGLPLSQIDLYDARQITDATGMNVALASFSPQQISDWQSGQTTMFPLTSFPQPAQNYFLHIVSEYGGSIAKQYLSDPPGWSVGFDFLTFLNFYLPDGTSVYATLDRVNSGTSYPDSQTLEQRTSPLPVREPLASSGDSPTSAILIPAQVDVTLPHRENPIYSLREIADLVTAASGVKVVIDKSYQSMDVVVCSSSKSLAAADLLAEATEAVGLKARTVDKIEFITRSADSSSEEAAAQVGKEHVNQDRLLVHFVFSNFSGFVKGLQEGDFTQEKTSWSSLPQDARQAFLYLARTSDEYHSNQKLFTLLNDPELLAQSDIEFNIECVTHCYYRDVVGTGAGLAQFLN